MPPPMTPTSFYKVTGLCGAWLGFAKPRPVYKAPALRASYRGRRKRLPPYPLGGGGKERVSWLPPTFNNGACGRIRKRLRPRGLLLALPPSRLRRYGVTSRSLKAREHLGLFRAALQPRRGILRCRYFASARGTKSLPCGLRARGRPARNKRVRVETVRDLLSVSANGRMQTNFPATGVCGKSVGLVRPVRLVRQVRGASRSRRAGPLR